MGVRVCRCVCVWVDVGLWFMCWWRPASVVVVFVYSVKFLTKLLTNYIHLYLYVYIYTLINIYIYTSCMQMCVVCEEEGRAGQYWTVVGG